jgi:hypothetical protein
VNTTSLLCVATTIAGPSLTDLACPIGPIAPPHLQPCRAQRVEVEAGPLGEADRVVAVDEPRDEMGDRLSPLSRREAAKHL